MARTAWIYWLSLIITGLLLGGVGGIPFGIPGEWTWEPILWNRENLPEAAWGSIFALLAGAMYVMYCCWGARRLKDDHHRRQSVLWLCGLFLAANGWMGAAQKAAPTPYNLAKAPWVTYYPAISGYFFHALHRIENVQLFLESYQEWMSEGDVLHVGTHPPGLYLLNWACLRSCEASPRLTEFLTVTMPSEVTLGIDDITTHNRLAYQSLTRPRKAALWGVILLTQIVSLAAIFPLYGMARLYFSTDQAWRIATLWPFVPALAMFLPKSDALYPCLTLCIIWSGVVSFRCRSCIGGLLTGFLLWTGMCITLAVLPAILLMVLLILWELKYPRHSDPRILSEPHSFVVSCRQAWIPAASMTTAFLACIVLVWWTTGLNLWDCWIMNLRNHAGFYDQYPRTYWKWLLVNPLEFAFAAGLPVTICAARAMFGGPASLSSGSRSSWGPYIFAPLVWSLLWISGKNMGEVARLWLFAVPWLLLLLPYGWLSTASRDSRSESIAAGGKATIPDPPLNPRSRLFPRDEYFWLIVTQMLAATFTMTHVSGFHFRQF